LNNINIALIGIGVMGENLALNIESKKYTVVVYDKDKAKVEKFILGRANGKKIYSASSLGEVISKLESPKKIFLMVGRKAC
jgi:6-phosphogluconate dehydrogenase